LQPGGMWAAVDLAGGQPVPLGDDFFRWYGEATQGRKVSARLSLPKPESGPEPGPPGRSWPLRATDFDIAGHANNAIAWAAVEDVLAAGDWRPARAELEYHRPMLPSTEPRLLTAAGRLSEGRETLVWLMEAGDRLV